MCLLLSTLDTSDGLVAPAMLLFETWPCNAFVDDVNDDEGFRLLPPLRDDVYGDLFLVIYSWAYNNTPMSLYPASNEIFKAVDPS